ncbi:MAG: hypothetical protein H0T91_07100 [Propionibacteriaceae bacterium]|nr:hypothetical protein [Propionibacteriaceae bacterium]
MAGKTTKKRIKRLTREQRQLRRQVHPAALPLRRNSDEPPDDWRDPEGGAGVREPRRPGPTAPAGAMELEPERLAYLDLVR